MEQSVAVKSLSALGHDRRMEVLRLLVEAGPAGMKPAAMLLKMAKLPASSLSSHLSILKDAGLITSEKISREILYRANLDQVRGLTSFLVTNCCGTQADSLGNLVSQLQPGR